MDKKKGKVARGVVGIEDVDGKRPDSLNSKKRSRWHHIHSVGKAQIQTQGRRVTFLLRKFESEKEDYEQL
jgi:hypothetical protein